MTTTQSNNIPQIPYASGTVESYNDRSGYGYLVPDEPESPDERLLVHRTPDYAGRDEMSCMYLGQLMTLITHRQAWPLFKHLFRDQRELQDLMTFW